MKKHWGVILIVLGILFILGSNPLLIPFRIWQDAEAGIGYAIGTVGVGIVMICLGIRMRRKEKAKRERDKTEIS